MPFLAEAMRAYEEGLGTRRGHRHRRAGRAQPPDGSARARRLHRPRRLPRGHARPRRRPRRRPLPAAAGAASSWSRPATSARRPGRGFYTYPRAERRAAGAARVTGGLTEEERLLQATAREFATRELAPTRDRARRGRALRPLALHADGRARPDRGAAPRVGRRRRASRTSAGRWSWRSSAPPTCRWRSRSRSTSCRSTRSSPGARPSSTRAGCRRCWPARRSARSR